MSTFETVITILFAIFCLLMLVVDIGLLISWSKAKEKVFVTNWVNFIYLICPLVLFISNKDSLLGWLFLVFGILTLPSEFTCISPEGIRTPVFIKKGLDPVENYSYEYKQNSLSKDTLYLYNKNKTSGIPFNIGIKKTRTVKMLADWYGKHDYENPLLKQE